MFPVNINIHFLRRSLILQLLFHIKLVSWAFSWSFFLWMQMQKYTGNSLVVNSSWKNPSGEWHVGCKLVYELFTSTLTDRLKVIFWIQMTFKLMFDSYSACNILLVLHCPIYSLLCLLLVVQKERKKKWDEKNQEAISDAVKQLFDFDKVVSTLIIIIVLT